MIEENDCRPKLYEDGGAAFPEIERSDVDLSTPTSAKEIGDDESKAASCSVATGCILITATLVRRTKLPGQGDKD